MVTCDRSDHDHQSLEDARDCAEHASHEFIRGDCRRCDDELAYFLRWGMGRPAPAAAR